MTWTRITGFVAGFLAILVYVQFLSVRVAVLIFLLFASCLVLLGLHLAEFATKEITASPRKRKAACYLTQGRRRSVSAAAFA
jgi:hypothetical protein